MNAHAGNLPSLQKSLSDLVKEYETKKDAIDTLIESFKSACDDIETGCTMGSSYVGGVWSMGAPRVSKRDLEHHLLTSAWKHVYEGLNINKIAPASDRDRFERALDKPPEFTLDNIRATFGDYISNSRFHLLRGIAEVFAILIRPLRAIAELRSALKSYQSVSF